MRFLLWIKSWTIFRTICLICPFGFEPLVLLSQFFDPYIQFCRCAFKIIIISRLASEMETEDFQSRNNNYFKIKSTTHGLSAIPRGINASTAVQYKRFEGQLKENAEREWSLLEFHASEAEKDRQHEARMAQLLMSLKSSHPWPQYGQSSSMQPFSVFCFGKAT